MLTGYKKKLRCYCGISGELYVVDHGESHFLLGVYLRPVI